ncbi:MAG TPA: methyltransferase domain-containing protein [Steroidobacteraceae bacterium]
MDDPVYVLGHSEQELQRLRRQAQLIAPATRLFLCEGGLGAGMRVLDVGSGAGDVAFLAAGLVGETGEIIGTDKSPAAVAAANARARAQGLRHVSFHEGDPAYLSFERSFDAVIGRYVLLFQSDASAMLRQLLRHLRGGGLVVFHEPDWHSARSIPSVPTYDRCCRWVQQTFARAGTDTNMAGRLYQALVEAGLSNPTLRMQTFIGGGVQCADYLQAVADLVGSMLPAMEQHGVASAAEVDYPTLAVRMQQETMSRKSLIIGRSEIGAWARLPADRADARSARQIEASAKQKSDRQGR